MVILPNDFGAINMEEKVGTVEYLRNRDKSPFVRPNFIIAGTIKAATSSVFGYLSAHPQVLGSSIKETNFFITEYTGDRQKDLERYSMHFRSPDSATRIITEASPGYLTHSKDMAARIRGMLPDVKLLFILRDPIDRLYSYYNFHMGQLTKDFDRTISFEEFIERCRLYSSGKQDPAALKMDERHLRALEIGRYSEFLREYLKLFPREQIIVLFYDDIKTDLRGVMKRLCDMLGIVPAFYDGYVFHKVNATFTSRMKLLHSLAVAANKSLEKYLRQRPALKHRIVALYKSLNQKREGYLSIPEATRRALEAYYGRSNKELAELISGENCPPWVKID